MNLIYFKPKAVIMKTIFAPLYSRSFYKMFAEQEKQITITKITKITKITALLGSLETHNKTQRGRNTTGQKIQEDHSQLIQTDE